MFGNLTRKNNVQSEIKKSIQKILDTKKDSYTRLKHLRIILDTVDPAEAKGIFECHYSHIYFLFQDVFSSTETSSKHKVQRTVREDLESVLLVLERILLLLPELLHQRWQLHSLTRVMTILLHPANILRLRREAMRLFLIWYQILSEHASEEATVIFATLVPGFPVPASHQASTHPAAHLTDPDNSNVQVVSADVFPILPPISSEKAPVDLTKFFLDCLLKDMATEMYRIQWKEKWRVAQCFQFLFDSFKQFYLPHIFPDFNWHTNVYQPTFVLPQLRRQVSTDDQFGSCRLVVIRWVANFVLTSAPPASTSTALAGLVPTVNTTGSSNNSFDLVTGEDGGENSHEAVRPPANIWPSSLTNNNNNNNNIVQHSDSEQPNSLYSVGSNCSDITPHLSESRDQMVLVRDILYGSRQNVNFVLEIFRQAFLLQSHFAAAVKRVILVYKDWLQLSPPVPQFLLEPPDTSHSRPEEVSASVPGHSNDEGSHPNPQSHSLRAGMQNTLQVFISSSCHIFLLQIDSRQQQQHQQQLEDQLELSKRVLSMYRYIVRNVSMSPATWERLVAVLLQVTSLVLSQQSAGIVTGSDSTDSAATVMTPAEPASGTAEKSAGNTAVTAHSTAESQKAAANALATALAAPLFQTLIVTWVRACLNVCISAQLWDSFLSLLSSLTTWEQLIIEWAKTMDTLTRVLARHVYLLDIDNLPLDRLSEQKAKRRRGKLQHFTSESSRYELSGACQLGSGDGTAMTRPTEVWQPSSVIDVNRHSIGSRVDTVSSMRPAPLPTRTPSDGLPVNLSRRGSTLLATRHSLVRSLSESSLAPGDPAAVSGDFPGGSMGETGVGVETHWAARASDKYALSRSMFSLHTVEFNSNVGDGIQCPVGLNSGYRSRSPSQSSCVETNSIKDSPFNLDANCSDNHSIDSAEVVVPRRSVLFGGRLRGWMPDVSAVLWTRTLSVLGNINDIECHRSRSHMFNYLLQLCNTLIKIENNIGVEEDRSLRATHVPASPLCMLLPWCLQAMEGPRRAPPGAGRLQALRLLCTVMMRRSVAAVVPSGELFPLFLRCVHSCVAGGDGSAVETLVRHCGPALFALYLPSACVLAQDFVYASSFVATSTDIRGVPRVEAVSIMGCLVSLANRWPVMTVLKANTPHFLTESCSTIKDSVVASLLNAGKREPSVQARCVAMSSLTIFVYEELSSLKMQPNHYTPHEKIKDAVTILLGAVKCNNKGVSQVAVGLLITLADLCDVLVDKFPDTGTKVFEVLCSCIENHSSYGTDSSSLIKPLILCVGEWCMRVRLSFLSSDRISHHLTVHHRRSCSLLSRVSEALRSVVIGGESPSAVRHSVISAGTDSASISHQSEADLSPAARRRMKRVSDSLMGESGSWTGGSVGEEEVLSKSSAPVIRTPSQLAAHAMICHLTNHLGHFPMLSGSVPLSALVSEHDDLSPADEDLSITANSVDNKLNSSIFQSPHVQFFVLNSSALMSLVELPVIDGTDTGSVSDFCSARSQVRVIIRDLSGKFCWDASLLLPAISSHQKSADNPDTPISRLVTPLSRLATPLSQLPTPSASLTAPSAKQAPVRHRRPDVTPTWTNTESGMDNLDDLMRHISHTSSECCPVEEAGAVSQTLFGSESLAETVTTLLCQRNSEHEHQQYTSSSSSRMFGLCGDQLWSSAEAGLSSLSHFQHGRLLFSQLALTTWNQRSRAHLLKRSDQLLREIKNLDNQLCRESHKIAVIYIAEGQEDKRSILSNAAGSPAFEQFISELAWEVELETHTGFLGGLQRNGDCGETAPYFATSFTEVMFHVSTRMPSSSSETLLQKTRHLGNDEVHIVWSEHSRDYRREIIATDFCDVLIVIYPLGHQMFRIQISRKPEVPMFGPLYDGAIVSRRVLSGLVRATAVSASRAKRSSLPMYHTYYEERQKSLNNLISNHRDDTSFEQFISRVFQPTSSSERWASQSEASFQQRTRSSSVMSHTKSSATVSAGDHHTTADRDVELTRAPSDAGSSSMTISLDPSPRTVKKMSFKTTVRKASSSIQETIHGLPGAARSHLLPPPRHTPPPQTPTRGNSAASESDA